METTIDSIDSRTTDWVPLTDNVNGNVNDNKVQDGSKNIEPHSKTKVRRQLKVLQALITVHDFLGNDNATETQYKEMDNQLKELKNLQAKYEAEVGDDNLDMDDFELLDQCFTLRLKAGKVKQDISKKLDHPGDFYVVAPQVHPAPYFQVPVRPFQTPVQHQNYLKEEQAEQKLFNRLIAVIVLMTVVALISYIFMIANHDSDDNEHTTVDFKA